MATRGHEGAGGRVATYRWQLTPEQGFAAAAAAAADLAALGVSHLYLSPIAEAVPGSAHGYDVVDPTRIREELGGEAGFADLAEACRDAGLRILLDIVPNHLAAHQTNPWWWDVLRRGRDSPWAATFDIDWQPTKPELADVILLPVLGDHYGRELEAGALWLDRRPTTDDGRSGELVVRYHDLEVPLRPETETRLQGRELAEVNADPDALDAVLGEQHFRLARWTVGDEELDYRRFFDIDALVATRVERPEVFAALHALPLRLLADERDGAVVDGFRIDHVDGLVDPTGYLEGLRGEVGPSRWLVVEKILDADEPLPSRWPVQGTTGYEVADLLGGWLSDPAGARALEDAWRARTGEDRTYREVAVAARREVLLGGLSADVHRVVGALVRVCESRRRHRDHAREALRTAVVEVAAHAPAYRSYARIDGDRLVLDQADRRFVDTAVAAARRSNPSLDPELLDLVGSLLLGHIDGPDERDFALRFQQLTSPVAAKGEEDAALYRFAPLPHRCEVGADPGSPWHPVARWHRASAAAHQAWPERLTTLSTHDTKRSADTRARLAALTAVPGEVEAAFDRWWAALPAGGPPEIDVATGWLVFHALVGAHPLPLERAWPVVEKSVREAGVRTSWRQPDERFESALRALTQQAIEDASPAEAVASLVAMTAEAADRAALAQLLAQLLAPGIPDLYQGGEGWDRSLVDPDNRRPVDPARRAGLVREARAAGPDDVPAAWARADRRATGLPRAIVVHTALAVRRRHQAAFAPGSGGAYLPLYAFGPDEARVLAFGRGAPVEVVAVSVRPAPSPVDASLLLPEGRWLDAFTGREHAGVAEVTALTDRFPVAVLERSGG